MKRIPFLIVATLVACLASHAAHAADGKLLLTGGVSSIDGAAGGGLTPWAMTGTYGSTGEWGASAFTTGVKTRDYSIVAGGIAAVFGDRLELSLARQDFDTRGTGESLGLPGLHLKQDIFAAKLHVLGDAILDSDRWLPEVALGVEHKRSRSGALAPTLASLGAADHGTDLYASATKLFLAQSLLVNGTLRYTKANQNGLLGFGGAAHGRASLEPEVSIAWLLQRTVAVGAEYRAKPDKLNPSALGAGLREDDWKDVFVAWAPDKTFSLTLAFVDLGRIVPAVQPRRQRGGYASAQLAF